VRPVSVNHCQESAVGSAEGASGSSATTGTIAGGLALEPGEAAGVELLPEAGDEGRPHQGAQVGVSADQRDLAEDGLDPASDRGEDQDQGVAAGMAVSWRGSPSLAPKLRLSNTSALSPAPAKSSTKLSRYISLYRGKAVRHDHRGGRATGAVRGIEPAP